MANLPRPFLRDADADHLVVRPEGAVEHHAVRLFQERPNMRLYLHKAGSIEEGLSGVGIRDAHADIVALARAIPMWRIWRRLARDGCRGEAQVSCSDYRELSAMIDRYSVPMNPAVMLKDIEHGISGR